MRRGALCISIDLELAWGIWDRPSGEYFERCARRETEIVRSILEIFERHEVQATWAIVGRLLERTETFPARSEHGAAIWFAPAIIEMIRDSSSSQEIGSHSFAHIDFARAPREQARLDLEAARAVHARHRLEFSSFVFPRNQVGHLDLLSAAGVRVFRSVDVGWHTSVRRRFGKWPGRAANFADKLTPSPPQLVEPIQHPQGVVELPSSMLLMSRQGIRRAIPSALVLQKARNGLQAAARRGGTFHLWFHPSNFYYEERDQLELLEAIVRHAAELRHRGSLEILPMNAYASQRN